jgi:hypothetical protein
MNFFDEIEKKHIKCNIIFKKENGKKTAEVSILGDKESIYQGLCNLLTIFIDNDIFDGEELCNITKNVLEHSGKYNVHIKNWKEYRE